MRIPLKAFSWFAIISTIAVPLAVYEQVDSGNIGLLLLIGIGVSFAAFLTYFLLVKVSELLFKAVSPQFAFLGLVIAGGVRGVVFFESISWIGLDQPTGMATRIIASIMTTVLWVLLFARIISQIEDFQREYALLMRTQLEQRSTPSAQGSDEIPSEYASDIAFLQSLLQRIPDEKIKGGFTSQQLVQVANELRNYVDQVIRPLSHQIWRSGALIPQLRIFTLIRTTLARPQFNALAVTGFVVGLSVANLTPIQSGIRTLVTALVLTGIVLPSFIIINNINVSCSRGVIVNVVILLIPGLIIGWIIFLLNKEVFDRDSGIFSWIFAPSIFFAAVVAAILSATKSEREQLIERLREATSTDSVSSAPDKLGESMKLASYLHNTLQSELLALSHQLEVAARQPDSETAKSLLERTNSVLTRSIANHFAESQLDPIARIKKLVQAWSGLLKITMDIGDLESVDLHFKNQIAGIVEELITNVFRHSRATEVSFEIKRTNPSSLLLTLRCDGSWNQESDSGIGIDLIEQNSKRSSVEVLSSGYLLQVEFDAPRF